MIQQADMMFSGGAVAVVTDGHRVEVNDHGVIIAGAERLELPNPRKSWKGLPSVEIEVALTPSGWAWSAGYWFGNGGAGGPLSIEPTKWHPHEPTREAALQAAREHLIEAIEGFRGRGDRRDRDPAIARALAWLRAGMKP